MVVRMDRTGRVLAGQALAGPATSRGAPAPPHSNTGMRSPRTDRAPSPDWLTSMVVRHCVLNAARRRRRCTAMADSSAAIWPPVIPRTEWKSNDASVAGVANHRCACVASSSNSITSAYLIGKRTGSPALRADSKTAIILDGSRIAPTALLDCVELERPQGNARRGTEELRDSASPRAVW